MTHCFRKMHGLALVLSVLFLVSACAAMEEPAEGDAIEGVAIQDGTVTALPGYYLQPNPVPPERGESAILLRLGVGGVEGTFSCTCSDTDSENGCKVRIIGDTMKCLPTVCKDCLFVVDIGKLRRTIAGLPLTCTPDAGMAYVPPLQADAGH